jgi:glycoprotein endo-alpha-1,2-mannosidase
MSSSRVPRAVSNRRVSAYVLGAVSAALLLVPTGASSARTEPEHSVAIFYYPWYSTPKRDGVWAHWYVASPDGGAPILSTRYYPARGLYSSSNPSVVLAQMREIAATGIRTVVVSWWGEGSPEAERVPLVAEAARRYGLDVAIHIEPYGGRNPAGTAADIAMLEQQGITDFYVYEADRDPPAEWAEALAPLDGVRVFAQTNFVGRAKAGGFDGLYTYSVGTAIGATFSRTCGEAHRAGLLCAPSVGPGYDARLATGDALVRPRLDGATYDRMWRTAVGAHPDLVTITSYNEWQEGTQIEPAHVQVGHDAYDGAWGKSGRAARRSYLDASARWVARFVAESVAR